MTSLFKREVPEVDDATVKIMGVARDPGLRAKVAVNSTDRDVDPVGACVGIRGSRIQNIVQELRGERIDIVVWSQDIAMYAQNALSPAVITRIAVDEDEKTLEVVVPDDQLTVAIGRKGQNVKLASRLLGWKIDVFTESRYGEMNAASKGMDQLASVAEIPLDNFISAGFETVSQVAGASEEILMTISGMTSSKVSDMKAAIMLLGIGDDETEVEETQEVEEAQEAVETVEAAAEESAEEETEEVESESGENETPENE